MANLVPQWTQEHARRLEENRVVDFDENFVVEFRMRVIPDHAAILDQFLF